MTTAKIEISPLTLELINSPFSLPRTLSTHDLVQLAQVISIAFEDFEPADKAGALQTFTNAYTAKGDNRFNDNTRAAIRLMMIAIHNPGEIQDIIGALATNFRAQRPKS